MIVSSFCVHFLRLMLTTSFLIHQVTLYSNDGTMELLFKLIYFSNPLNRNALNKCCDGDQNSSSCSDGCETFFVVCINSPSVKYPKCIQQVHSKVFHNDSQLNTTFDSSLNGDQFLISVTNIRDLQTNLYFTVALFDDDTPPGRTFNGSIKTSELITSYTHDVPLSSSKNWSEGNFSRNGIAFKFLYRLKCNQNYYGKYCTKKCEPRHGNYGYSRCLENGTEVCLPGYIGIMCDQPICLPACGKNGICDKPNYCRCYRDWTGPTCEQCIPPKNCLHATCEIPGRCKCKPNWTGQYCNIYDNYCSLYHPCKNGGTCKNNAKTNYTCSCTSGFTGTNCEDSACSPACNLSRADCLTTKVCSCHEGWKGENCSQCIPLPNCTNGYCVNPDDCICRKGWSGKWCNVSQSKEMVCSEGNPCQKNGVCKSAANGTYYCVCRRGFTGRHCENDTCHPSCNKTRSFCNENNKCSCLPGWTGETCSQCAKNLSCINGYCSKPFECICNEGWTGTSCNLRNNTKCSVSNQNNPTASCVMEKSVTSNDSKTIAISVAFGVILFIVLLCVLTFVWRYFRRRTTFCVTRPTAFVNRGIKQSYNKRDNGFIIESLNNNNRGLSDLSRVSSTTIFMNPSTITPNKCSSKNSCNNMKTCGSTSSADSGFCEEQKRLGQS